MMRYVTLFLAAGLAAALPLLPMAAQEPLPPVRTVRPLATTIDGKAFLVKIEAYLNTIRTARADFEQTAPGMRAHKGTLTLARPGRMRLEYTPPPAILLVADRHNIIYYDKDLDQITYLRPQDLPISFLLEDRVDFSRSGMTAQVVSNGDTLAMEVSRPGEDDLRPVTFHFRKEPLTLLYWNYLDEQGNQVTVTLKNLQVNIPVRDSLFVFRNPRFGK